MSEEFNAILQGSAHINIGKNGVTEGILSHMRDLMKGKKFLKIKVLKEAVEEFGLDNLIAEIIRGLEIYVYDVRGHVIIISKRYFSNLHQPKTYFKMRAEIIGSKKGEKSVKKSTSQKKQSSNKVENVPSEDFIDFDNEEIQTKLEVMDLLEDGLDIPEESEENDLIEENTSPKATPPPIKQSKKFQKASRPAKKTHGKKISAKRSTKKTASKPIGSDYKPDFPSKRRHQKLQPKSGRNSLKREGKKDG